MQTVTLTKTKTKLLIATAALAAAGGLAFILFPKLSTNLTLTSTSPTYTCSDSDGGNKPFVKGIATIKDQYGNIKSSWPDICSIALVGLRESLCTTKKSCADKTCTSYTYTPIIVTTTVTCTYGCSDGACRDGICTDANWSSTLSPTPCPSSGTQTKTWTKIGACTGGVTHPSTESVTCTPVISGVCGSSNNTTVSSIPTTDLCSAGIASAVAGSGPWAWSCFGTNGGTTANCSAQKTAPPTTTTP